MSLPERIGRYEIVEELGHGAMGSVFKARDPMVGRIVALKTIHSAALAGAQSEEYRERFHREARASGVLAHPGIVPVFDVGDHEGAPFLVMEFVDGRTLGEAIKKGERFSLDHICEIGQQIAEALGYAHRKGVIHRDVKPANILLTSREVYGSERPRITDFGIAKLAASEITTTGQLLGTPSFMAPEQFTGSPVDGRADLFSLGVILYSLATGEQPFAGETMTAVSYKIVYTEPIPPSKLNPALSPRLEAVILKCLAKNPADRYSTGEQVAQDLAAVRASAGAAAPNAAPIELVDADATLGPAAAAAYAPVAQTLTPATVATTGGPTAAAKKTGKPLSFETLFSMTLLAIAGLAAALAGTWFMFEHIFSLATRARDQAAITQPAPPPQPIVAIPQPVTAPAAADQTPAAATSANAAPSAAPTPAAGAKATTAPATAVPITTASAATTPKPATPKPKPAAQTTSAAQSAPPPTAVAAAAPSPAAAPSTPPAAAPAANVPAAHPAFNPRTLDPNASTKLKIDTSKFPSGLPFTVEMNKQTYLRFITGDGTDLENLYVPAGVQEFRVLMKTGGQERDSNVVSDNFRAKKHRTLRIQIMDQGNPVPKVTLPLGKDAQLYLSLN